jgi:hypothetical protein
MRNFVLLFASILMLASCSNDDLVVEEALVTKDALLTKKGVQDTDITSKSGFKVSICHKDAGDIVVSESALATHQAHGDAVDEDGDGFYDIDNPCSETDSNDNFYSEDNTGPVIGDFHAGGIVFYVADAPTDLDGDGDLDTGLVCAIEDQKSGGIVWYNPSLGWNETGATGIAIGTGSANTMTIIASQGATETSYAAGLARAYGGGGFNDWFLPSKNEVHEMYFNIAAINTTAIANDGVAFEENYYWSSSEISFYEVWRQDFWNGYDNADDSQDGVNKGYFSRVRAVRAF